MSVTRILRQRDVAASFEGRAVVQAALSRDIVVEQVSIDDLAARRLSLRAGTVLPVGSVEFVREAMSVAGVNEPLCMSYPQVLCDHLLRDVRKQAVGDALATPRPLFVKPVSTKLFTGFVFRPDATDEMTAQDRESLDVLRSLRASSHVWVSEPVEFVSEWRYYVKHGRILGAGRYDQDGEDDAPIPDPVVVEAGANTLATHGRLSAFALDYGVLADGRTALVEVNDFWALGLYRGTLSVGDYLSMLCVRWQEILRSRLGTLVL